MTCHVASKIFHEATIKGYIISTSFICSAMIRSLNSNLWIISSRTIKPSSAQVCLLQALAP